MRDRQVVMKSVKEPKITCHMITEPESTTQVGVVDVLAKVAEGILPAGIPQMANLLTIVTPRSPLLWPSSSLRVRDIIVTIQSAVLTGSAQNDFSRSAALNIALVLSNKAVVDLIPSADEIYQALMSMSPLKSPGMNLSHILDLSAFALSCIRQRLTSRNPSIESNGISSDSRSDAGLTPNIWRIILSCISSSSFQIQWNGKLWQPFFPTRGVRQGYPLSPYIFILAMECLGHLISHTVSTGTWQPFRFNRGGDPRAKCSDFGYIIDKIPSRLQGWAARTLSMAGCVTLAKSVLSAIPVYFMQTSLLPKSVCNEIGKILRWGSTTGAPKISLINRENICQPMDHGGLGIRRICDFNLAFILKIAFSLVTDTSALWVRLLRQKYKIYEICPDSVHRTTCTPLWRAISTAWNDLKANLPRDISFSDLMDNTATYMECDLEVEGAQRIRLFLRLASRTNVELFRRFIAHQPHCPCCLEAVEATTHTLRDCRYAQAVWRVILPNSDFHLFFLTRLEDWMLSNLKTTYLHIGSNLSWPLVFASTLWQIWKNRNDMTFNPLHSLAVSIATRSITWSIYYSESSCTGVHIKNSIAAPIHWHPPPWGWICLNTDEVFLQVQLLAPLAAFSETMRHHGFRGSTKRSASPILYNVNYGQF
ncbi:hypothetical protein F3Y22_tig00110450pilonHSYRG00693 [Hibiscus syriacus]|uniref:Reverse transcriptase zinc-binding domain-containing protein n=1 Tax=Hibiscus syriacus TaxID=106335 RepID=A0A6A3AJ61_HIBSY|nr:hypothetical protein F3Y22_tig00110450pilonHSYRG00693 [Hibiscus syriacus]